MDVEGSGLHLDDEVLHLKNRHNIYVQYNPRMKSLSQWGESTRVASIFHMQTSYDRISRLLPRFNIKAIYPNK